MCVHLCWFHFASVNVITAAVWLNEMIALELPLYSKAAEQEETYSTSATAAQFLGLLKHYVAGVVTAINNFGTPNLE